MTEKKYIVLKGLEGNPPAELNSVQLFLEPYVGQILTFWWLLWWGVLLFMVVRFIAVPLYHQQKRGSPIEKPEQGLSGDG